MTLDAERWARADALFADALGWPHAERRARLAEVTGDDDALREEVLALVASHETAERRIGESAIDLIPAGLDEDEPAALQAGDSVGPYRVVRELGRGGMGAVYLAERADETFARKVAIKVIHPGVGAGRWARRFEAERRILARLEHPNVARLYDSLVTHAGASCLVMEYVAGTRIDRHADDRRLGVADRLRLFVAACHGVSYAHQQLVVHRDLKPANIWVTEAGEVKLLDFGIARLVTPDPAVEPLTRAGIRPITPEYAAPEQLRGEPPSARMDVYSLGVVLHELLTGARPAWQRLVIDGADAASLEAALVPPSQSAAGRRRTLRGDLDTIVLTALAPDQARRYPSVEAFRDDIGRYLAGLPIRARPASAGYRLARFVARNRALVATAVVAAGLAVVYLVTVQIQARRIGAERDRAELERRRADQVVKVLTDFLGASDPFAPGRQDTLTVGAFLAQGAERIERDLAGQPGVLARALGAVGRIERQLGRFDRAAPLLERAVALAEATPGTAADDRATSLADLGLLRRLTSRLPEADSLLRAALAVAEEARDPDPGRIAALEGYLATVWIEQGWFDSAATGLDRALMRARSAVPPDSALVAELLASRAAAAQRRGDRSEALRFLEAAWAVNRARLGDDHPTVLADLGNLGFLKDRMGNPAEAVPMLERAAAGLATRLGADHRLVLAARRNLGGALSRSGRLDDAIQMLEEVATVDRARLGGRHFDLGISLDYLGGLYDQAGRFAEAERAFRDNYEVFRDLVGPGHFNTALALARYAWARCRPGRAFDAGRASAVLADFERALAVIDTVLAPANHQRIGRHVMYGTCLSRAGLVAEGERELFGQFALARGAFRPGDPTLRFAVGELAGHFARTGDAARLAWVEAVGDSLGVRPARPDGR